MEIDLLWQFFNIVRRISGQVSRLSSERVSYNSRFRFSLIWQWNFKFEWLHRKGKEKFHLQFSENRAQKIFELNAYLRKEKCVSPALRKRDTGTLKIFMTKISRLNLQGRNIICKKELQPFYIRWTWVKLRISILNTTIFKYEELQGGFPMENESQISLLITYSLAIFIL